VEVTLARCDVKRGRFLIMEGTETLFLSTAGRFKLYVFAYDIIDRCVIADVLNILIFYATGHIHTLSN
jgi:hypothetical protein